jgi:hypothetical protein
MYDTDPARTHTVQYTARQWTRLLLGVHPLMSQHLVCYVLTQLPLSDHYPADRIAVSATPRKASCIAAVIRDYERRGY